MYLSSMTKDNQNQKFGEVFAKNVSLDRANKIRSIIKMNTIGLWVFVYKGKKNFSYEVGVQNAWGGPLSMDERKKVKEAIEKAN